ncbi:BMA-ATP-5 [Dirofilaria immitis]|nr:BMA-ATP-5 [Dirofilaria immitis]
MQRAELERTGQCFTADGNYWLDLQRSFLVSSAALRSMATKRFTQSAVNFKTVSDLVGKKHSKEIAALAHHHHQYLSTVMSKPAELPKYDFAKLKKQMPEHAAVLDKLQKQYEAIKIPFHTVPEQFIKIKAKYENMPPIEHFRPEHYAKFFPEVHRDVRLPIERFTMGWGNTNTRSISKSYKNSTRIIDHVQFPSTFEDDRIISDSLGILSFVDFCHLRME